MPLRLRHAAVLVAGSMVMLVGVGAAAVKSTAHQSAALRSETKVPVAGIRQHLVAFQGFANRNGGNRLAGTPGYDASARYVAARMRAAGYSVRLQEFPFPFVLDRSPPSLRPLGGGAWSFQAGRDYSTFGYSGSGQVEAPVAAVDLVVPSPRPNASSSGCEASDFAGFPGGAVALLQRGTCFFRQKVENAVAAGASGVVVFNEGNEGRRDLISGTLGPPQVRIPAVSATFAVGDALRNGVGDGPTGVTVRLRTDMIAEQRTTRNVIAESRRGNPGNVVVVGAHLDSVQRGPGINDNGSGSATILEAAEQLAGLKPRNKLRFIWWGAEELGLLGSRHYVSKLSAEAKRRIALYINLDMVGSPNFVRFVYDGDGSGTNAQFPAGSAAIERLFARYFAARKLPLAETGIGGSDHLPFAQAGIPVGGLFTGTDEPKSAEQARVFGGTAGQPLDPCYHRSCDTLANVNNTALAQNANALAYALTRLAQSTSRVNGR
jgi:Zn-dependent M28 family amino/carboxypeptidase